jgi:plastocyanin domain-containing protein
MKSTVLSIIIAIGILGGAVYLTNNMSSFSSNTGTQATIREENIHNVSIVDGKQIIEVNVKGGYSPKLSAAKAGIPTILRFKTNGTFDCSSSVRISSMNISKTLPNTGITDIDLGNQKLGALQGTCGMGMYTFTVNFQG